MPVSFGDYLRITPGISMNNIGGMSMDGFGEGYNNSRPLAGPFQTINLSLTPSIVIPLKKDKQKFMEVELMGGYFIYTSMGMKLNKGNFDDMILESGNYEMIRSDVNINQSFLGHGWVFGLQLDFRVSGKIWGYVAGRYFLGQQSAPISGSYQYYRNGEVGTQPIEFSNSFIDYQGFQLTIGGGLKKK